MRDHILVTGATRGIGRSVANRLLREGYDLSFTWVSSKENATDIQKQADRFGANAYAYQCDLTDIDQTQLLAEKLLQGPPLNGMIYCATETLAPTYAADLTAEDWLRPLNINLISPFILCSQLGPSLKEDGVIVTVSSPNATVCQEGMSVYAASKAALESFSRVQARELGSARIRVNVVRPGPTMTDGFMAQVSDREVVEELSMATPLGRIAQTEDVADAIFSLLGSDTRWMSGEILNVSGGLF